MGTNKAGGLSRHVGCQGTWADNAGRPGQAGDQQGRRAGSIDMPAFNANIF